MCYILKYERLANCLEMSGIPIIEFQLFPYKVNSTRFCELAKGMLVTDNVH